MGKMHISLPDDLHKQLDATCEKYNLHRARVIQRGIRLALDEAEALRRAPAGLQATNPSTQGLRPAVAPAKAPAGAVGPASEFDIETVLRGATVWFHLDPLLDALKLNQADLMKEIDEEDDILVYMGKRWVANRGFAEARTLCQDPGLGSRINSWAEKLTQALLNNTQEVADAEA